MEEERARQLVEDYSDMLLRIGYTWLGDLDDAKDVCQAALIRAWQAEKSFPTPKEERAWMVRVVINLCKDWKKSAWVRHRADLEEGIDLQTSPPEEGGVLELVQALPEKDRQVIYLRYYEGYEVREMARLLSLPAAVVSNRLSRARRRLRNMMEEERHETVSQ